MIIEQLRNLLFLALFTAILVGISQIYRNNPVCPFDFVERTERYNSFVQWEKEFRKNNPNANIPDMAKARKQFYVDNNCKEATERPVPKDYGIKQADETTQKLLDIIENYNL